MTEEVRYATGARACYCTCANAAGLMERDA